MNFLKPYWWLIPFLCCGAGYFAASWFVPVRSLFVPSVLGQSAQEALSTISAQGLGVRIIAERPHDTSPDGTVFMQNPAPGHRASSQQTVFLVIARNNLPPCMSELRGLYEKEIDEQIKSLGCSVIHVPLISSRPVGMCIGQIPDPGEPVTSTTTIRLFIAQARVPHVLVPACSGHSWEEVKFFCEQQGVAVQPYGQGAWVVDQRPYAGSIVDRSQPFTLHCTLGERSLR